MPDIKEIIARRAARELRDGDVVNLGIGLPTLIPNYIPKDMDIIFQSENGMARMGPKPEAGRENPDICNAGGQPATIETGGAFFDSAMSFAIIRGGHVDVTVLGALQVDETGSLASHIVPGKMVSGMGGAMDLMVGSRKVIVATTHTAKGAPKIVKRCTYPLTAVNKVNLIITELGVMEVTPEGLALREVSEGVTVEYIQSVTEAALIVEKDILNLQ
jgi:acetate CoA/acetoacetate CoA-transferase beta subunit